MESTQRDILTILLGRIFELGLISEATYKSAVNSLATTIDFPEMLWYPMCLPEEVQTNGSTQNTQ